MNSIKNYLPIQIINKICFQEILFDLIGNQNISYNIIQTFFKLIFNSKEFNLNKINFKILIIQASKNNSIGTKIIQCLTTNLLKIDKNNNLINLKSIINAINENKEINENHLKVINDLTLENNNLIDLPNENNNIIDLTLENNNLIDLPNENNNIIDLTLENNNIIDLPNESNNKIDLPNESNNKIDLPNESNNIIDLPNESNIIDLPNENNNKIDLPNESNNKIDLPNESNNKIDLPNESNNKIDLPNESNNIIDLPNESNIIDLPNENNNKIDLPNESNNKIDLPNESNNKIDLPNESNNIINLPNENNNIIDLPNESNNIIDLPNESNIIDLPNENNNKIDLPNESNNKIDLPNESNNKIDLPNESNNKIDLPNESNNIINLPNENNNIIDLHNESNNKIDLPNESNNIIYLPNENNNKIDLPNESNNKIDLPNENNNIIDLNNEDRCIIDLTDENSINELTDKSNSMNNSLCIKDTFKDIITNNEYNLNNTFHFHYKNSHLNKYKGNSDNNININNIYPNKNNDTNYNINNYNKKLTILSDLPYNLFGNNQNKDFKNRSNEIKKSKTNTYYDNISINYELKNNEYKYFNNKIYQMKFYKTTKEDINLLFINCIKKKNIYLLKKLLKNDKLKNIEINSNKVENEYPLILAFNNCISINDDNIYKNIYRDLYYYEFKEKEIKIFKILLENGADLNVKLNNENTILEESLNGKLHLINKVIIDFLIKENKKREREQEREQEKDQEKDQERKQQREQEINYNMEKLDKIKDRYKYNYIQKDELIYNESNNNFFINNKYILYKNYEKESIDDLNKNRIKGYNYSKDIMTINQNKRYRASTDEIYQWKNKKIKYNNITINTTLKYIKNIFEPHVYSYLFDKNFNIKKWININNNINEDDNYDYKIVYYTIIKEDREIIKYIINHESDYMIRSYGYKYETILYISIILGLKDVFLDIIQMGKNIRETIMNNNHYAMLIKTIILNDYFSFKDKEDLINALFNLINIHEFYIYEDVLFILMDMKSKDDAYKLACFFLERINLKIDYQWNDIYKNSLYYAVDYNLYEIVKLLLKKEFRYNFEISKDAIIYSIIKAIRLKNIKIVTLLLNNYNGNTNWFNSYRVCPIKLAVDSNDLNLVKLFVDRGSNLTDNIIYGRKYSILYYALIKNDSNEEIIKYLIEMKAKMNIENKNEFEKLFSKLDDKGKIPFLKYFVNYDDKNFIENLLKYSIIFNREDILEILFRNNLNPENKIKNCTLWKFARQNNITKMCKYLTLKRKEITSINRKRKKQRKKEITKKKLNSSS
ncbi:hypothetical protein H8356DRAFT_1394845 [Neocallimastix lanati (nom. inval.)]|nr:hypothetical protein H8356DRAFT_1394845 [Neocallimastix sp. JGI-2020a]